MLVGIIRYALLLFFLTSPLVLTGNGSQKSSMMAVVPIAFYTPETGFAGGGAGAVSVWPLFGVISYLILQHFIHERYHATYKNLIASHPWRVRELGREHFAFAHEEPGIIYHTRHKDPFAPAEWQKYRVPHGGLDRGSK